MTYDEYNAYCGSLPAATHVVQWGGAHVWKVGGKVFAIGGWSDGRDPFITFKTSEIAFEMLKDQPGLRPAPYLASRGMTWIQHYGRPDPSTRSSTPTSKGGPRPVGRGLSKRDLKAYIAESHRLVALGLSRKKRRELGLE